MPDDDLVLRQLVATLDDRTTPLCLHAAGQIQPWDKPFDTLGGEFMDPPFHLNCRSFVAPWVPGSVNEMRRMANEELQRRPASERRIGPGGEGPTGIPPAPRPSPGSPPTPAPAGRSMTSKLNDGPVEREVLTGGNRADSVELLTFDDGSQAVLKKTAGPFAQEEARKEFLAARVANVVGIDDYAAELVDDTTVLMSYMPGKTGAKVLREATEDVTEGRRKAIRRMEAEFADLDGGPEIGRLDWLIDNADRHDMNYIVNGQKVSPIDHGNARFSPMRYISEEKPDVGKEVELGPYGPFVNREVGLKTNKFNEIQSIAPRTGKAEATRIREKIEGMRDEFDNDEWWEGVLERARWLEREAK